MVVNMNSNQNLNVILLAGGDGKRMKSSLPKVLHEVGGRPMIYYPLKRIEETQVAASVAIVVGKDRKKIETYVHSEFDSSKLNITWIFQPEPKGTGNAVRHAMESEWGERAVKSKANILILPGDTPLLTKDLLFQMSEPMSLKKEAFRLLTCELENPFGYGRVVRRGKAGTVLKIVEEKDATARQKEIREVAVSIYYIPANVLKSGVLRLTTKNAQKEYYLTDLIGQATRLKKKVNILKWDNNEDLLGVNNLWEIANVSRIINLRIQKQHALNGVRFIDPITTWVDVGVDIGPDTVVSPGVILSGNTKIGRGVFIGPNTILSNTEVESEVKILAGTISESSKIAAGAKVGPYAHLRPESYVGEESKIGNFVELKKTSIGKHTSVAHLSYVGDAEVGDRVNIGCGFITCNFDGRIIEGQRKHKTIIENEVFMGSDCQTIAPVRIGEGSYVASGSTITKEVMPGDLAIARSRQINKEGYAKRLRPQKSEKNTVDTNLTEPGKTPEK